MMLLRCSDSFCGCQSGNS